MGTRKAIYIPFPQAIPPAYVIDEENCRYLTPVSYTHLDVYKRQGLELVDIPEFSCCGYPVKSVHHETAYLLAARNLALAEERGLDILTLCSACTSVLTEVSRELAANEALLDATCKSLSLIHIW